MAETCARLLAQYSTIGLAVPAGGRCAACRRPFVLDNTNGYCLRKKRTLAFCAFAAGIHVFVESRPWRCERLTGPKSHGQGVECSETREDAFLYAQDLDRDVPDRCRHHDIPWTTASSSGWRTVASKRDPQSLSWHVQGLGQGIHHSHHCCRQWAFAWPIRSSDGYRTLEPERAPSLYPFQGMAGWSPPLLHCTTYLWKMVRHGRHPFPSSLGTILLEMEGGYGMNEPGCLSHWIVDQ